MVSYGDDIQIRTFRGQGGFSLISMALVILAIGLFGAAILKLSTVWDKSEMSVTTAERQKAVEEALFGFMLQNGRFPCPAPLSAEPDTPEFSHEVPAGSCTSAPYSGTFRAVGRDSRMVRIDAVPARILNIDDSLITDGWGHRFVYAVTEDYAAPGAQLDQDLGAITVYDGEGHNATAIPGNVVYALLSQGPDPRGAYNFNGRLIEPCDIDAKAGMNCDFSNAEFINTINRAEQAGAGQFLHRLTYQTLPITQTLVSCDDDEDEIVSMTGNFCMLALNNINKTGIGDISSSSCGIAANNNMSIGGISDVNVVDIGVVGHLNKRGKTNLVTENFYSSGSVSHSGIGDITHVNSAVPEGPVPDPLADTDIPEYDTCAAHCSTAAQRAAGLADGTIASVSHVSVGGIGDHVLEPGVYCGGVSVGGIGNKTFNPGTFCGGITVSGISNVHFNPGVYVVDSGDLRIGGIGNRTGDGVSFVLTSSTGGGHTIGNVDVIGIGDLNLHAPSEGEDMAGILFYQDRAATGSSCNSLGGISAANTKGAYYFPSRCLDIGGIGNSACMSIIAHNINIGGIGGMGHGSCDGIPVPQIGWPDDDGGVCGP